MNKRKNRRLLPLVLAAAVILTGLSITAAAEAVDGCAIVARTEVAAAGTRVAVDISVSGNPGFTNLGIALDYDRDKLELVSLTLGTLCGELAESNIAWDPDENGDTVVDARFDTGKTYGYVVCASEKAVQGDGELFTAVFQVKNGASGTANVTPVVYYIRDNTSVFSVFAPVEAVETAGAVVINNGIPGDFNQDGVVLIQEVLVVLAAYKGSGTMTEEQMNMIDTDGNGVILIQEVLPVLAAYKGS